MLVLIIINVIFRNPSKSVRDKVSHKQPKIQQSLSICDGCYPLQICEEFIIHHKQWRK